MTGDSPGIYPEPPRKIVDPVGIRPIPDIPLAMRGCWDAIPPEDPEEPGGPHRIMVTANSVTISGPGSDPQVGTAEFVTKVGPTSIEGRWASQDRHGRSTVATGLELDPGPPATLTRDEGDAGDAVYRRCK